MIRTSIRSGARTAAAMIVLAVAAGITALAVTPGAPASAAPGHDRLVRAVPRSGTPNILNGRVLTILEVGSKVIAGGTFTQASNAGSTTVLTRNYLLAFDKATGAIDTAFVPQLDNEVRALLPGPTAGTVYVGGRFSNVNGAFRKGITLLNVSNGSSVTTFRPPYVNGIVQSMAVAHGRLLLGGTFTTAGGIAHQGLASLNPSTGALDAYLNVQLTEHHNYNGTGANAPTGTEKFALSPDGSKLIVIGNFRKADGLDRDQAVMINLSSSAATIANWHTLDFTAACARNSFDSWVRDVAFSPDGTYFAIVTTGAGFAGTLCDSTSRWESSATGSNLKPTWVNWTGGDSLYSVEITEQAVYIGGHIRWVNSSLSRDVAGPGAIGRASIAVLSPQNGLPYSWNMGRNPRGFGITDLYATSDGLWLGYDNDYVGNFQWKRQRIAFLPLSGGTPVPAITTAGLPGKTFVGGLGTATTLAMRTYDGGSSVGPTTPITDAGNWQNIRGSFWISGMHYYGWVDGNLYKRPFNGTTFGGGSLVAPYQDNDGVAPDWDTVSDGRGHTYAGVAPNFYGSELQNVTGMFYNDGKLYYTLAGQNPVFWRFFNPESGAISSYRNQTTGCCFTSVAGGLFVANGFLYLTWSNGNLYRMGWVNGNPAGTAVVVSGPTVGGIAWNAKAVFLGP